MDLETSEQNKANHTCFWKKEKDTFDKWLRPVEYSTESETGIVNFVLPFQIDLFVLIMARRPISSATLSPKGTFPMALIISYWSMVSNPELLKMRSNENSHLYHELRNWPHYNVTELVLLKTFIQFCQDEII